MTEQDGMMERLEGYLSEDIYGNDTISPKDALGFARQEVERALREIQTALGWAYPLTVVRAKAWTIALTEERTALQAAEKRAEEAETALKDAAGRVGIGHALRDSAFIADLQAALAAERAKVERVRALWPHIETLITSLPKRLGDPGSPTCLRCKIEKALEGP